MPNPARAQQLKVLKVYGAPNGLQARERFFEAEGRVEGILTHALLAVLRQAEGCAGAGDQAAEQDRVSTFSSGTCSS